MAFQDADLRRRTTILYQACSGECATRFSTLRQVDYDWVLPLTATSTFFRYTFRYKSRTGKLHN